nr:MFS transporter [Synergistales bacterium]
QRLGLSLTEAGMLTSLSGVLNLFMQPMLGYMSDRTRKPLLIGFGPLITALGAAFLPVSPSFGMAFMLVGIWSAGSAMFHPQALGAVGYVSSPAHISFHLSIFQLGGTLGMTLSPLYAIGLVNIIGYRWMPLVCALPVTLLAAVYFILIPRVHENPSDSDGIREGMFLTIFRVFMKVWPVWSAAFTRDLFTQAIRFLLPIIIASKGGGLAEIGTNLFFLNLSRSILTVVIARIGDRVGRKEILLFTLWATPVLIVPSIYITGLFSSILLTTGFALVGSTLPITAGTAQELAPENRSIAGSILMGLSFGLSGMMMTFIGGFADLVGLQKTMLMVALLPFISALIVMKYWREPHQDRTEIRA